MENLVNAHTSGHCDLQETQVLQKIWLLLQETANIPQWTDGLDRLKIILLISFKEAVGMGLLVCSRWEVMKVMGNHYWGVTEGVVDQYCAGPAQ